MEHDGGGQQAARASMSRTGTEVRARYDYGGKERKESWWQCLCGAAESAVGSSRAVELAAAAQILRGEDDTETEKPRGSNWVTTPRVSEDSPHATDGGAGWRKSGDCQLRKL